jgi:Type I phosphodiesterase / nucleotide pyrophosphatase
MTTTDYDSLKVDHVKKIIEGLGLSTPTVFGMNFQVCSQRFACLLHRTTLRCRPVCSGMRLRCQRDIHDAVSAAVASDFRAVQRARVGGSGVPSTRQHMQAVSIAQKTSDCGGGYKGGVPASSLKDALKFVDDSLLAFYNGLDSAGVLDNTVVIVSAKHGQVPRNRKRFVKADDGIISDALGDSVAQLTTDAPALIWLTDSGSARDTGAACCVAACGCVVHLVIAIDVVDGNCNTYCV